MTGNFANKLAPLGCIQHNCGFVRRLGEGSNGVVDLVEYKGRMSCLKIGKGGQDQIRSFMYEAFMMMVADGAGGTPRVIMVASDMPGLLMTYCPHPSLLQLLEEGSLVTVHQALGVFKAVTMALIQLHGEGISHNDLKCDNILVDLYGTRAFIIDLGMASPVGQSLPDYLTYFQDTDVDSHKDYLHYDLGLYLGGPAMSHCDVYSLGVILNNVMETLPHLDNNLYGLCNKMRCREGSARLTLPQVMNALIFWRQD